MQKQQFNIKEMTISVSTPSSPDYRTSVEQFSVGGIDYLQLVMQTEKPEEYLPVELEIKLPLVDIHSCWTPGMIGNPVSIRNKGIAEWRYDYDSKISKLAPVSCWYSLSGGNRLTVGLSEAMESVSQHVGSYEEERCGLIKFRLFAEPSKKRTEYKVTLRLDSRDISFFNAIENLSQWYEESLGQSMMAVPEAALEPVFSTWYNFHQNVEQQEIEQQCQLAVEAGCKTIILDDGWQTDDNNRGYRYCGDWQVSERRFPDMKGHVGRVQDMGMRYMLWLSVPFLGNRSQAWDEYKEYLLFYNSLQDAGVLDPRYKKVRDYLVTTYSHLVREYNFDGLKLDFIDEFDLRDASEKALAFDPDRDIQSLQEAVNVLLTEIKASLTAIKPDILIEFRQKYIGPMIRQFGNMFRVHDCPHDSIMNRVGIMDLRMFSGNTAVHSDMAIWTPEDTVESASLHFINTLFSVPQISPDMKELNAEHNAMVKHWLGFWNANKPILLKGKLSCSAPEMQYPVIKSRLDDQLFITVHGDIVVDVTEEGINQLTLVNGAMTDTTVIRLQQAIQAKAKVHNCLGVLQSESVLSLDTGLTEVTIPHSGYVILQKM